MSPGEVVLMAMPQSAGGAAKLRPALVLSSLPGIFQTILVCGISTQLSAVVANWDEEMDPKDADFPASGLRFHSIIRLSYLYGADASEIVRNIGIIDAARLKRLLQRLSDHFKP